MDSIKYIMPTFKNFTIYPTGGNDLQQSWSIVLPHYGLSYKYTKETNKYEIERYEDY